ncbi:MAG: polyhydroxyalkanoate depolymerase, partial [Alphaproteobacteria bacterium]|nr:polyhydroxyalkanoate depolymerase [Alphaproteobacteria bacterium]
EHGLRSVGAAAEMLSRFRLRHDRPDFAIERVQIDGSSVQVHEETVHSHPFVQLLHFRKEGVSSQPRVLLVAPWAGHFSTLLRDTAASLLVDHDVYLTDWRNARDVPQSEGSFGLDSYIAQLIAYFEILGPDTHVVAVCQPCPAALAAVAVMAAASHPAQPSSLTLMAGPVDTRINPTTVNELATANPIAWFERNLISTVPYRYPGARRRVYPGFLQVGAFVSMNPLRHWQAHVDLYSEIACGDSEKAKALRDFYDEYFSVLDLPAEFYLETVERVFQEFLLPLGRFFWMGERIEPAAIRNTALLTVEGERDDICGVGQTRAAHILCSSLPPSRKHHHIQADVGHFGVFSGRRWQRDIYPVVKNFIANSA